MFNRKTGLRASKHRHFYFEFYSCLYIASLVLIGLSVSRFALFHSLLFLGFAVVFRRMTETYSK